MLLHPEPSAHMLLEYMNPNIAQIARTWVAATILTGHPIIPPITQSTSAINPTSWMASSEPSSLLIWEHPQQINLNYPNSAPSYTNRSLGTPMLTRFNVSTNLKELVHNSNRKEPPSIFEPKSQNSTITHNNLESNKPTRQQKPRSQQPNKSSNPTTRNQHKITDFITLQTPIQNNKQPV
jgi:hypothetical protein